LKTDFIIDAHPEVTRIAVLEDGRLMELIIQRANETRLVGNINLGRVNAVLPGMQAAFVDIGLERSAFLHVSDVRTGVIKAKEFAKSLVDGSPLPSSDTDSSIEDLLRNGQEVLVQVTKEPIGTKGARVSCRISIAGRYVVSMPGDSVAGVSRKIADRKERIRIRNILRDLHKDGFGVIARTAATGQSPDSLKNDFRRIVETWKEIGQTTLRSKAPALIHKERDVVTTALRDLATPDVHTIVTNSKEVRNRATKYLKKMAPKLVGKVKLYKGKTPIFDHYDLEGEIAQIMAREVPLKSGGSVVIEHTEALVAIDVNTKRYVGKRDQDSTIFKTNMEAAKEVARQLRLRDMGGIIVIDFIDMENQHHKEKVLNTLRSELGRDRSPTKTCQVSPLGLVEMTRKRVRPSLVQSMSEPCSSCGGSGRVLSPASAATMLERFLERASIKKKHKNLVVTLHPKLASYLLGDGSRRVGYLANMDRMKVELREDPKLRVDEFRAYSLDTHEDVTDLYSSWNRSSDSGS
jgi:ribonuclease G